MGNLGGRTITADLVLDDIDIAVGRSEIMGHLVNDRAELAVGGAADVGIEDHDLIIRKRQRTAVFCLGRSRLPGEIYPVRVGDGYVAARIGPAEGKSPRPGDESLWIERTPHPVLPDESDHVAEHGADHIEIVLLGRIAVEREMLVDECRLPGAGGAAPTGAGPSLIRPPGAAVPVRGFPGGDGAYQLANFANNGGTGVGPGGGSAGTASPMAFTRLSISSSFRQ